MKKKKFYSLEIDELIEHFSRSDFDNYEASQFAFHSEKIAAILLKVIKAIQSLTPEQDSRDLIWSLWL